MSDNERLIIEGVREDGSRLRPSDWIERISATLAHFGSDHRLHYAPEVQPCIIEGKKCLVVDRDLGNRNPAALDFILTFARSNQLRIIEDRRTEQQDVEHERRSESDQ